MCTYSRRGDYDEIGEKWVGGKIFCTKFYVGIPPKNNSSTIKNIRQIENYITRQVIKGY